MISVSAINMLLRCGRQYKFRYIDGLKIRPVGSLVLGKAFHITIAENFRQKLITEKDLSHQDLTDIFKVKFEDYIKEAEIKEDGIIWQEEDKKEKCYEDGNKLVVLARQESMPLILPDLVEHQFVLDNFNFKGYVDLLDKENTLIEFKTASKSPPTTTTTADIQIMGYSLFQKYRKPDKKPMARKESFVRLKTPKRVIQEYQVTDFERQWFLDIVKIAQQLIDNNIYIPNPNGWHCSEKWCGYYNICRSSV